jgi:hypothetical protein
MTGSLCAVHCALSVAARWTPRVSPSLYSLARKRPAYAYASHALAAVDAKPGIGRREALRAARLSGVGAHFQPRVADRFGVCEVAGRHLRQSPGVDVARPWAGVQSPAART